jgi:adiponectin receptor
LLGIKVNIVGKYLTGVHFAFYCLPGARLGYSLFMLMCAVGLGVANWHPAYSGEKYHNMRTTLFILCVGSSIVPTLHWFSICTPHEVAIVFPRLLAMFGSYGLGLICYVWHLPESLWPGYFDVWGHSHQWWHVFITTAMIIWEAEMVDMMVYRILTPCSIAN